MIDWLLIADLREAWWTLTTFNRFLIVLGTLWVIYVACAFVGWTSLGHD